jgi:hypothetical protein
VGTAITLDLVIGLPALAWFLVLRRNRIGSIALVPVAIVGFVAARTLVPAPYNVAVIAFERLLPVLEVALLAYVAVRVRRVIDEYRRLRASTPYGFDALEQATTRTFGSAARVLSIGVTEVALIGLAAVGWRRRYRPPPGARAYSTHVRNGYTGTLAVMGAAIVIETAGIHLLVQRWSDVAAWLLTTLSVYSLIWLLGDYHGVRLNPHVVDDRTLHARAGLRWRAEIPLEAVRRVLRYRHTDAEADVLSLALFGDPDVVVDLDRSVTVRGLFGTRRAASALGLSVDDRTGFVDDVTRRMTRGS